MQEPAYMPRPGDLLLCYDGKLIDEAIDAVEEIWMLRDGIKPPRGRQIYSHAAVYVGNGYVIEALGNGLVRNPFYGYFGKADVWGRSIGTSRRQRIVNKAEQMLAQGYRYSLWDIFVQFMYLVFGVRIQWKSMDSIVCSVFGYDCWSVLGLKIAQNRNCCPEEIAVYGTLEYLGRL